MKQLPISNGNPSTGPSDPTELVEITTQLTDEFGRMIRVLIATTSEISQKTALGGNRRGTNVRTYRDQGVIVLDRSVDWNR